MSAAHDGGQAFPGNGETFIEGPQGLGPQSAWGMQGSAGMSLRNYFAAKAMQGLTAAFPDWTHYEIARAAYGQADAMIAASK